MIKKKKIFTFKSSIKHMHTHLGILSFHGMKYVNTTQIS